MKKILLKPEIIDENSINDKNADEKNEVYAFEAASNRNNPHV